MPFLYRKLFLRATYLLQPLDVVSVTSLNDQLEITERARRGWAGAAQRYSPRALYSLYACVRNESVCLCQPLPLFQPRRGARTRAAAAATGRSSRVSGGFLMIKAKGSSRDFPPASDTMLLHQQMEAAAT